MKALLVLAMIIGCAATAAPAVAAEGRWCAVYANAEGGENCYFATYGQCMADLQGKGGWCRPNHSHSGRAY